MNIILVVFDSLRKDCIETYGAPPWGKVNTPNFDKFAEQSLVMNRAYPEALPTLPTRRALYSGRRVYPFENANFHLKGDFVGAPGWGPIPENQATLAEMLKESGYRTALIADVYHMFKPSKNYWRGFDQWMFLRGQEKDPARSGPRLNDEEVSHWLPEELRNPRTEAFIQQCIMNIHDRKSEEDYFAPRVLREAARWIEQNRDAENFFLTVESFDPHEPWLVPQYYSEMYLKEDSRQQVVSGYKDTSTLPEELIKRTRANYSGAVTQCDRWFGFFMETLRVTGRLDDSLVILTSDHGHSIGDREYLGKRGYPSAPEVFDIPLMLRFPGAENAGKTSDMFLQHIDISAEILHQAAIVPPEPIDGIPFIDDALSGGKGTREHVTVGWGAAMTVIDEKWWFNCKVDGTGVLLYDISTKEGFGLNVADNHPEIVKALYEKALEDAGGKIPDWIIELARKEEDAPGCSDLAARD